jgi:hypothetical protein
MFESRNQIRFSSLAKTRVDGFVGGEALLKDISVTGCRLEFSSAVAFNMTEKYRLIVLPEREAQIEEFELEAQPRWSMVQEDCFDIGFSILSSPKGRTFQRYVDYLAWRTGTR